LAMSVAPKQETHSLPERPEGSPSGLFFCPRNASQAFRMRTRDTASSHAE
jgi:hypothetical protein